MTRSSARRRNRNAREIVARILRTMRPRQLRAAFAHAAFTPQAVREWAPSAQEVGWEYAAELLNRAARRLS